MYILLRIDIFQLKVSAKGGVHWYRIVYRVETASSCITKLLNICNEPVNFHCAEPCNHRLQKKKKKEERVPGKRFSIPNYTIYNTKKHWLGGQCFRFHQPVPISHPMLKAPFLAAVAWVPRFSVFLFNPTHIYLSSDQKGDEFLRRLSTYYLNHRDN